jgi:hypothetical protein
MNELDRIREVAQEVREWAETLKGVRLTELCGYCAIASAELYKRLKRQGIGAEICVAHAPTNACSHVFLIVEDQVVDVTATQFPEFHYERVVIMHEREAQQHWFYCPEETFFSVAALRRYQAKTGWPQYQIAHR